ncbi:MAG TPA: sigma 54-interacting transcriptional regulator [Polyangiaceae bacterium]|nr:sigma 54-interacting transcriptional regulator [Polyangiaceae bacterium]
MNDERSTTNRKITLTGPQDLFPVEGRGVDPGAGRFGLLMFCDDEAQFRSLDVDTSLVIGRERPSEIVVNDPSVSRQHARFVRQKDEIWVEDLDSRNGVFFRGERVRRERLDVGDAVIVGRVRVVLAGTRPRPSPVEGAVAADGVVLSNVRMKRLYVDAARAAAADVPVLVLGETGVGKELVARAIHRESPRRDRPWVAINCAAIPAALLESTLFGHERGAFTGAHAKGIGVFERAHGGVLFLDEIGDLGSGAQVALLRAIETRRITRVGSSVEVPVDVRIVSATHCDLSTMVEEGTFRRDLYYRLNGVALEVPPLRERQDEIEPLARQFLTQASAEWRVPLRELTPEAVEGLRRCPWPGNVRQLRYAVERAALLARHDAIGAEDFRDYLSVDGGTPSTLVPSPPFVDLALRSQLQRYERSLIEEALRRGGGSRLAAAKLLRIPLRTLFRKMRALGAFSAVPADDDMEPGA